MARYVTVGSISGTPSSGEFEALHEEAAHYLRRAVQLGAQVAVFPEIYPQISHHSSKTIPQLAEPLDGPSVTRMTAEAKRHGVHLIWPLYTQEGDRVYNSSVLLGPTGEIIGVYHKMFPTIGEIESGCTPGTEPGVFDTEFGRFGMVICFDLNFPEILQATAAAGAEVIFFSSAYRGGLQLSSWAYHLGTYLVSAVWSELGLIVDLTGRVLAESTYERVITHRLNLDRTLMHMDGNWSKLDEMLAKYGAQLSIDFCTREACWAVGSESDAFTVQDIMREFSLEPRTDYFDRARAVRRKALGS